ncbi:Peptidoglycan-binding domain 1 [Thauera phenylacetica B4P]|uniref:Peptidoglycan-binding domain 1 n=1 Tax=Thauera phenylacetica B4P TaxID=1234382 RepID=N7A176_9RHOO|nr:Peptidoglycan-binding domain 1 [Thauera phenylacetica B4P]
MGAPLAPLTGSAYQVAQYSNTVLELQRELNQLGFNAGPVDGVMGARTRSAIRAYQADNELLVDGQPMTGLLAHVRATGQGRTPAPATPTSGVSSRMIADIQEALRGSGYTTERESGRLDDQTRAAIRRYESDQGLLMSGEPSAELLRHLRERANATSTPSAQPVDANTLARIQAELRERGYPIPLVSGRMDAPTRQAIREYQQGQGVSVSGEPSQALLDALRTGSADTTPELGLSREQRAAAQRALNAHGYDAGPPDGVLGPRSRAAIRTFQAANQLGATGTLDAPTLQGLGVAATRAATPPATAASYRCVRAGRLLRRRPHTQAGLAHRGGASRGAQRRPEFGGHPVRGTSAGRRPPVDRGLAQAAARRRAPWAGRGGCRGGLSADPPGAGVPHHDAGVRFRRALQPPRTRTVSRQRAEPRLSTQPTWRPAAAARLCRRARRLGHCQCPPPAREQSATAPDLAARRRRPHDGEPRRRGVDRRRRPQGERGIRRLLADQCRRRMDAARARRRRPQVTHARDRRARYPPVSRTP